MRYLDVCGDSLKVYFVHYFRIGFIFFNLFILETNEDKTVIALRQYTFIITHVASKVHLS